MKLSRIITHMKQRNEKLLEYNKEVVDSVKSVNIIKVEKLDEILKDLLRISNYPMEPATDGNVAGYICKILDNGEPMSMRLCTYYSMSCVHSHVVTNPFKTKKRFLISNSFFIFPLFSLNSIGNPSEQSR